MTAKESIEFTLKAYKLNVVSEYKFHPERRWKSDWFLPDYNTIIEYEGLMAKKARHTTVTGYTKDCEKYNAATLMGFKVLRYTTINYHQLVDDLDNLISQKNL
jgi:hypothetical protein